jgi:hypothetical protein
MSARGCRRRIDGDGLGRAAFQDDLAFGDDLAGGGLAHGRAVGEDREGGDDQRREGKASMAQRSVRGIISRSVLGRSARAFM